MHIISGHLEFIIIKAVFVR